MNNNHIVIGSAGHIDHGKSSIVKAITNIDPTRLKEEIEKSITIDLGFSYFHLDNQSIAIVDLPGHEKFVTNMIVGSSNIDMILFVIAADDGIMPQTIEHFEILKLLEIKHAIIVLNKIDLVSEDLIKQREDEIREFFKDSDFNNSPIIKTSIYKQETIDNLKNTLETYIKSNTFKRREFDIFRMAIDRSFSIKGLGTIITGTSQGKELFVNESLQIYPSNHIVKVKNIQNHNIDVPSITSGHRSALQLSKISKEEIKRGDIIASVNSLRPTRYIDVIISVLETSKPIKNNQLIRIFHQTKEFIGRVKLVEPLIKPNTKSFATIILQDDIYAIKNDLGIIRSFSPIKTIAGLKIVNILENKPKISANYYEQYLENNISNQILNLLKNNISVNNQMIYNLMPNKIELDDNLNYLIAQNKVLVFNYKNKPNYILEDTFINIKNKIIKTLEEYHESHSLFNGMPILDLHKKVFNDINYKIFKALFTIMYEVVIKDEIISLKGFKITYTNDQKAIRNTIMTTIKNNGYSLLSFQELYERFSSDEDKLIIQAMLNQNELLIIDSNYVILDRMYSTLFEILKRLASKENKIYLADFKNEINVSRKYCLLLLEHFDHEGVTKFIDDYRILNNFNINKE